MSVYFYQATDRSGKLIEGDLEAPDYRKAVLKLRTLNYLPIKVSLEKPKKSVSIDLNFSGFAFLPPVSQKELLNFTQQLATLVSAGLTLDKSLSILVNLTQKPKAKEVLSGIQKRVHSGSTFADALAEHPKIFSNLYVNMVRAGEAGGVLGAVLNRLLEFMEKTDEMKKSVQSALVYPVLLTLVGGAAVAVLMTVVIPKFADIFGDMGQSLPMSTAFLLALSSFLASYWWAILLVLIGVGVTFKINLKNEKFKFQWDTLVLRLPLFGSLMRKIEISRFSRTLGTLIKSGVPILQALYIIQSILNNSVIAKAVEKLHKGLKGGKGISGPLAKTSVFPPLAIHMITVGEETGTLEEMLTKVSDNYDKEIEQSIKQIIALIEPFLILLMGLVVGFIVISMLLAIFSINDVPF